MHRFRTAHSVWLAIAFLAFPLLGCQPGDDASPSAGEIANRFDFLRTRQLLVRIDTMTGQVSYVHVSGDGGFVPLGGRPNLEGRPEHYGRFVLYTLSQARGGGAREEPNRLLRIDRATGYGWIADVLDGATWAPIAEPDGALPGQDTPFVSPGSSGAAKPAASTTQATPAEPDTKEEIAVISSDALAGKPEEVDDYVAVVTEALNKEGLTVEMKVWAVSQLGQMDPAQAVPPLIEALESEHPEVVVAAIKSLQQVGSASTIPKILKLRQHPDPRVRETVDSVVKEVR